MKNEKILDVLDHYERFLTDNDVETLKASKLDFSQSRQSTLGHCLDLILRIRQLLTIDRDEALIRFGFLQGVFWIMGIKTIYQLQVDNGQFD
ncbi:TPA: hypothetical protein DF272_03445 [Candidatus Falkowbacteria bacterium]|nr:hypothetical protein [Candidatus Falkowbacteria bacterium]